MPNPNVMIRPFNQATEVRKLSAIWLEASPAALAFIGSVRPLEQQGLTEEQYLPPAETWVACRQGEDTGFIRLIDSFVGTISVALDVEGRASVVS